MLDAVLNMALSANTDLEAREKSFIAPAEFVQLMSTFLHMSICHVLIHQIFSRARLVSTRDVMRSYLGNVR